MCPPNKRRRGEEKELFIADLITRIWPLLLLLAWTATTLGDEGQSSLEETKEVENIITKLEPEPSKTQRTRDPSV